MIFNLLILKFIGLIIKQYNIANIIEYGSGLSTLFLNSILDNERKVYSIEHSSSYYKQIKSLIKKENNQIHLIYSPIRLFQFRKKGFTTYSNNYLRKIRKSNLKFDLVIIDGPPARKYGREGTIYQIYKHLTEKTIVILDDTHRPIEMDMINNWCKIWNNIDIININTGQKGFSIIRIQNPLEIKSNPFKKKEILKSWFKSITIMLEQYKLHRTLEFLLKLKRTINILFN